MIKEVIMPKLGQTMEEGIIERWVKKEGEKVEKGDVLLEITTDKATLEVEAASSGILKKITAQEGETVPVKEVIAYIGDETDVVPETVTRPPAEKKEGGRVTASPRARRLAKEKGIDLEQVSGTGPGGKIVEEDVIRCVGEPVEAGIGPVPGKGEKTPASRIRKLIAERVSLSKRNMPHFYLTGEADMTVCRKRREGLKKEGGEISYLDFIIRAAARALRDFPRLGAVWENGTIVSREAVDIGVIVALDEGVIIPVIRNAADKALPEISRELRSLVERAKKGKLLPDEFSQGTFTVSNLGMLGVTNFFAVINPGESAILAVGEIKDTPVVRGGEIVIRPMMKMSLSCDHRLIDGAAAGKFLQRLKDYLEEPEI